MIGFAGTADTDWMVMTMADRNEVITHLEIMHTWAAFALEKDLDFFEPAHIGKMAKWTMDAIELLKEYGNLAGRHNILVEKLDDLLAEMKERNKPVVPEYDHTDELYHCPVCGADLDEWTGEFCQMCGRRLDWDGA